MFAYGQKFPEEHYTKHKKRETPIFLYHGEHDPMILWDHAKLSYEEFEKMGFKFTLKSEPGLEHSLSLEEIKEVSKFLNEHMI